MSHLLNVAAIVALMPTVVFAETLEEKLNREKAVLDSLNNMLEKEREELSQTEIKKLTIGAMLDRIQREEFQARREIRGLSEKERNLQARLVRTREALNIAERQLEAQVLHAHAQLFLVDAAVAADVVPPEDVDHARALVVQELADFVRHVQQHFLLVHLDLGLRPRRRGDAAALFLFLFLPVMEWQSNTRE